MAFEITKFKASLDAGVARSNLFQFDVIPQTGLTSNEITNLKFVCKTAQLPGLQIEPTEVKYLGRVIKFPGDIAFEPFTTSIINDNNYSIRTDVETWMANISDHKNISKSVSEFTSTGILSLVNEQGEVLDNGKKVKFFRLFPTTVSEIALSFESRSEIETFDITWSYDYYEILN